MRHRVLMAGIMLVAALVLTACGGGGGGQQGGGGGQQGGGTAGAVNVTEKEWTIELASAELSAGQVKFTVKNDGAVEHNFVIKEANVRVDGIQPGMSKDLTTSLKPGTYTVECDIPGHAEAGMKTTVTVK